MLAPLLIAFQLAVQDPVVQEPGVQEPGDGRAFVGCLVDDAGEPVSDAVIELQLGSERRATRSGADGGFRLPYAIGMDVARARFLVRGKHVPEVAYRVSSELELIGDPEVPIQLGTWLVGRPSTLVGRVVDKAGEVVLAADVTVTGARVEGGFGFLDLKLSRAIDPASGEFRFEGLPPGAVTVVARAKAPNQQFRTSGGFTIVSGTSYVVGGNTLGDVAVVDLLVEPGVESFQELVIEPPTRLEIALDTAPFPPDAFRATARLEDGSQAVTNARTTSAGRWPSRSWGKAAPRTYLGLEGNDYRLVFDGDPIEPVERRFDRDEGSVVVPIRPASGVVLALSVPAGEPAPARLKVEARLAADGGWADPIRVYTGAFVPRLDLRLPQRLWCLVVEAEDWPAHRPVVNVRGATRAPLDVRLDRPRPVRLRFEPGPCDVPVEDVLVMLERGNPLRLVEELPFVTDARGEVDLGLQLSEPGRLRVRLSPWLEVQHALPSPLPDELVIAAPPVAVVRGRILLPEVENARALRIRPQARHSIDLAEDGGFVLGPIAPGEYVLELSVPGVGWTVLELVDFRAGENPALEFDLRASHPGELTVDLTGIAPERLDVSLRPTDAGATLQRVGVEPRKVHLRGVPPDEYEVTIEPRSGDWAVTLPDPVRVEPGRHSFVAHELELFRREVRILDADGGEWGSRPFLYSTGATHAKVARPDERGVWVAALPEWPISFWRVTEDRQRAVTVTWGPGSAQLEARLPGGE